MSELNCGQKGPNVTAGMMSIDSSFFDNFNKAPGEEYFKYIDERINN